MSAVNIVVLPGKYKTRELTSVSFLGPLLEKTALEIMMANKPVGVTTSYQHSLDYTHGFDKKDDLDKAEDEIKDEAEKFIRTRTEQNIGKVLSTWLHRDKEVPTIVTRTDRRDTGIRSSSGISGPVSEREVIYRPRKPKLPSRIAASAPFNLELEFSVSAQGEVNRVVPAVSSGNPEVDLLAVRYLKSWKFAPLAQGLHEEQKGKIKFIFNE
jgi:TonB family protein